ncbi:MULTISPECIES: ABC transporter substrate-binding protein [unclassified Paenibacillus]|uniref:ABC transporter substrate-binding protein n=1 Tax=unclassified Paenibacillus TaxID=185978 RepID=UPI00277D4987|nr:MULTISPECIES: ABC transporter substrate-binding protein [unclassified Paenibacillus]MDQ0901324.1 multiple sugar transport system substrate-binding protein [Paenibacillus sp. V4I7]MDQ0920176.1 multiple sugar transport system substrate-binding protein [Paenibacillus sp. V4I5]
MVKMKRFQMIGLAGLSMAMVLSGCSSTKTATSSPAAATPAPAASAAATKAPEPAKSAEKVTVNFWTPFSGNDGPFMKKIVDNYNKSQEKYTVKMTIQPNGDYYKLLDTAIATKKGVPDVAIMHLDQTPTYIAKDLLQPLDEVAKSVGVEKSNFPAATVDYSTKDGKWYSIPLDVHPLIMYYNKDLFKAAGITAPPTNRQEFVDAAKKLTDPSKGVWGAAMPTFWIQNFLFPTILFQNGGNFLDDKGNIAYNSPAGVEAVTFMRSLSTMKVSPPTVAQDGDFNLFQQGKSAMHFNGPWSKDAFDKAKINYGVAPVPQLGTVKQAVFGGSHNFVIPKTTTDANVLAGAGDFLKFVSANSIDWAESGQAVASKVVRDSAAFKAMTQQQTEVAKSFDYVQFAPKVLNWGPISDSIWTELANALQGKKDPKAALDDAAAKSTQAMKK